MIVYEAMALSNRGSPVNKLFGTDKVSSCFSIGWPYKQSLQQDKLLNSLPNTLCK